MKQKFDVTGMTCSACSSRVEKCVAKLDGVEEVSVNLLTNSMQVEFDQEKLDTAGIRQAVEKAGYGASPATEHRESVQAAAVSPERARENPMEAQLKNMKMRLWVSFIFLIPLMYVSMGHMAGLPLPGFLTGMENAVGFALTQFLLCLPILYVNRVYYIRGYKSLFHRAPNMDSLIAIGSTAALVYGLFAIYRMGHGLGVGDMDLVATYHMDLYFESAAMILALITLGKFLETKSKGRTSEAITKLIDLAPKTAIVERDGRQAEIPVEQVLAGDIVLVKPGQSVPVDGVILEGSTSIDEAAITGESIPVPKEVESTVIAATMNKTGFIKMRATRVGDDTTFSQIIRLVEEASSSKAPIAKLADKIAGIFVPTVIIIAVITAVVWLLSGAEFEFALSSAISVLVISCPCALGLATPVAIMVGTGKGAENGILIKSGEALETAHSIQSVVLDKTGTLTQGKPVVTDVLSGEMAEQELLELAAGLEAGSEHPLAEALMEAAKERQLAIPKAEDFQALPGMGLEGKIGGSQYYAGNQRMMEEKGISMGSFKSDLERLADEGKTPLLFADDRHVLGIVAVADVVKPTSAQAVQEFAKMGIEVVMLTGDNQRTAKAIQKQLHIPKVIAEVLPQDKEREVARLQQEGKTVAMIGDGVNDAPALARADVGMAIGAGTDVAIESADVVLMKNDLLDAVTAIRLSKAVIRNIKQNLFWAFFYNTLGIPLAAGVFYSLLGWKLNPMFAAAAMSLSSVFVVSNALRLKFFKNSTVSRAEAGTGNAEGNHDSVQAAKPGVVRNLETEAPETKEEYNENCTYINQEEKENEAMKTMKIEGMMCQHCQKAVEKALNAIDGVSAEVDLEKKAAYINVTGSATDETLAKAVTEAGYEVVGIE